VTTESREQRAESREDDQRAERGVGTNLELVVANLEGNVVLLAGGRAVDACKLTTVACLVYPHVGDSVRAAGEPRRDVVCKVSKISRLSRLIAESREQRAECIKQREEQRAESREQRTERRDKRAREERTENREQRAQSTRGENREQRAEGTEHER
jgi:hypothetical protein